MLVAARPPRRRYSRPLPTTEPLRVAAGDPPCIPKVPSFGSCNSLALSVSCSYSIRPPRLSISAAWRNKLARSAGLVRSKYVAPHPRCFARKSLRVTLTNSAHLLASLSPRNLMLSTTFGSFLHPRIALSPSFLVGLWHLVHHDLYFPIFLPFPVPCARALDLGGSCCMLSLKSVWVCCCITSVSHVHSAVSRSGAYRRGGRSLSSSPSTCSSF